MCGIIGFYGLPRAPALAREALTRLEYRGYDSAGIAWRTENGLDMARAVGRVQALPAIDEEAQLAIGHTRWATHGGVTERNAHPHMDPTGKFAIVHNGTLEHHARLREGLVQEGHTFQSETDSEVFAHLYERERRQVGPMEALKNVLGQVEGSWALVVLDGEADALVFARHRTPLLVGDVGEGRYVIASDVTAVIAHTDQVIYLDDGDRGIIQDGRLQIFDEGGEEKAVERVTIDWNIQEAELAGFPHFMLKEIHDAPIAINAALAGRIHRAPLRVRTGIDASLLAGIQRIRILACGTSYHAGLMGRHFLEAWAGVPTEVEVASEFRVRPRVDVSGTLTIGISQSGETLDTLEALRELTPRGWPILGICNTPGSSLERLADDTILTAVGPEVGVAATKTFLGQVIALACLALEISERNRSLPIRSRERIIREMEHLPRIAEAVLEQASEIRAMAHEIAEARDLFFLGRGIHYPTALEAALKFKEITYHHAEGMGAAELKHGPFALLSPQTPCIFFVPLDRNVERNLSSIIEVAARDAPTYAITAGPVEGLEGLVDGRLVAACRDPVLAAVPFAIVGQLLAYESAVHLGREVDRPRNLAKSVTVE